MAIRALRDTDADTLRKILGKVGNLGLHTAVCEDTMWRNVRNVLAGS